MLEFDGSNTAGQMMVIGNQSSGGYMFKDWIVNLEVYDTVEMCAKFIQACMKQFCNYYGGV